MRPKDEAASGFTLMEVVVTLAILSISLTALYQVFSSVARGTRVSANYYRALEVAETQMARLTARMSDYAGASGTEQGGFHWRTQARPYNAPLESPLANDSFLSATEMGVQPYLLTVRVSWGEGRERDLELSTIRLGGSP